MKFDALEALVVTSLHRANEHIHFLLPLSKGSRKKKFFFNDRAIEALNPHPLELNGRRIKKKILLSLMAGRLFPPPRLNGTAIKKELFCGFLEYLWFVLGSQT